MLSLEQIGAIVYSAAAIRLRQGHAFKVTTDAIR
jgi:hypothetical protein